MSERQATLQSPYKFLVPFYDPLVESLERPFSILQALNRSGDEITRDFGLDRQKCEVTNDDSKFAVKLDVSDFKPEELEVTTRDNELLITGKHEERQESKDSEKFHGYISRQFSRRYALPKTISATQLTSMLKDGCLIVEAPKAALKDQGRKKIPIQQANM